MKIMKFTAISSLLAFCRYQWRNAALYYSRGLIDGVMVVEVEVCCRHQYVQKNLSSQFQSALTATGAKIELGKRIVF